MSLGTAAVLFMIAQGLFLWVASRQVFILVGWLYGWRGSSMWLGEGGLKISMYALNSVTGQTRSKKEGAWVVHVLMAVKTHSPASLHSGHLSPGEALLARRHRNGCQYPCS